MHRTALAIAMGLTVLAGCASHATTTVGVTSSAPPLDSGKGGITGLLVDDVYRPVPGGLVLLVGTGLTATSDDLGQFSFSGLEPGSYIADATANGHEAAPVNVDVKAGQYSEVEIQARRLFSANGTMVTSEYSVFISCAIDFVVNGIVTDCTGDQSGDTFRPGYTSDYSAYNASATYLVVEMAANKADNYEVQLRQDDGSSGGGPRYAVADFAGTYLRMQFKVDEVNTQFNGQGNNVPFNVTKPIALILFSDSTGRQELQNATGGPTGPICCGAGAHFGIQAKFLQTLFLGKPDVDVDHYCVLGKQC